MKNFSVLGVHRKIQFLWVAHEKPIYRGMGGCLKRGSLDNLQIADLRVGGGGGSWQEKGGVVF